MRAFLLPRCSAAFLFAAAVFISPPETVDANPAVTQDNGSLSAEMELSTKRALEWLCAQQNPQGYWSDPDHPALTALALLAIQHSGPEELSKRAKNLDAGFAFLRSQIQPDGGVYKTGLSNYNTSLALMAFAAHGDPQDAQTIRNARAFLIQLQAREMIRPELNGGIGYGPTAVSPKRQHPDLDNTLVALEALRASEVRSPIEEKNASGPKLDWDAAIQFISKCQNAPAQGNRSSVQTVAEESERGGFVYYPGFSNAGEVTDAGGNKSLRASGTMSYAGLLSFIYAEIPKDDSRMVAALDWLRAHYTLKENPGLGTQGLFYYYHLMSKALTASGVERLQSSAGEHLWKRELAVELVNRQERQGFWVNQTGRWMEKDPVLVTSYALLTLGRIRSQR